ncbi:MAG: hypothetical protein RL199_1965 [Pseudomonadota bacterium]|jgi:hypothetical protein
MSHREVVPDEAFAPHQPTHNRFLFEGVAYPTDKQDLVEFATDAAFDIDTLNLVRALPDREYLSRDDVWRAWGEACRKVGGGARNLGTPRDDIGREATNSA